MKEKEKISKLTKKDKLLRMLFQTEEIVEHNKQILGQLTQRMQRGLLGQTKFWEGYLKALGDVAKEIFGTDIDSMTFEWKLKVGERLQKKFSYSEVGFCHNGICYTVNEVLGLLAVRNLFANNMGG